MAAERYIAKGNGWEVRISRFGVRDVVQQHPGLPVLCGSGRDQIARNEYVVRCLGCGDEIVVKPNIAPVCEGCRD